MKQPKPWETPYGRRKEKTIRDWISGIDASTHAVLIPLHDKGPALLHARESGIYPVNFGPYIRKRSYFLLNFRTERDAAGFRLSYPGESSLPE